MCALLNRDTNTGVDVQAELRLKTEAPDTTAKTSPMPSDSAPGPAGALHT